MVGRIRNVCSDRKTVMGYHWTKIKDRTSLSVGSLVWLPHVYCTFCAPLAGWSCDHNQLTNHNNTKLSWLISQYTAFSDRRHYLIIMEYVYYVYTLCFLFIILTAAQGESFRCVATVAAAAASQSADDLRIVFTSSACALKSLFSVCNLYWLI